MIMHHIRGVIKNGRLFGRYSYLSISLENPEVTAAGLNSGRSFGPRRFLCSSKPPGNDNVNENENEKSSSGKEKQEGKGSERSTKAKARLDSLLKSIVKESKEAAEKPEKNVVDMRLAAPKKESKLPKPEETKSLEDAEAEEHLGKEMVTAVKKVAETVEGDSKAVESELVQKLKTQVVGKKVDLSELFAGMKIDRTPRPKEATAPSQSMEMSRAHRVRRMMDERSREPRQRFRSSDKPQRDTPQRMRRQFDKPNYVPIDLFGASPLGIFTNVESEGTVKGTPPVLPKLETWDALHARDLKLAVTHPPANGFEEMILWTEQGKLWKFPIDNEQGLDEEAKVPFHEHVFLEPLIEGWCPKKGPVRHFMELVCVGLSKNPFLTVKEKHDQIEWYHQYFRGKSSVLKETGAGEVK